MPPPKKPEIAGGVKSPADILVFAAIAAVIFPVLGAFILWFFRPVEFLLRVRAFFAPFLIQYLLWLQIGAIILSTLFLWGIISMIIKTSYIEMKREQFLDILGHGRVSKRRSVKAWKQIKQRMLSENQNDWKLAILESDKVLDEILKMAGYIGANTEEKLRAIIPAQLSNIEDVKMANLVSGEIMKDPTYEITLKKAKETIEIYRIAFVELNLINE